MKISGLDISSLTVKGFNYVFFIRFLDGISAQQDNTPNEYKSSHEDRTPQEDNTSMQDNTSWKDNTPMQSNTPEEKNASVDGKLF